jgi:pimeloyl-ACP methyl ester carboxylesterase
MGAFETLYIASTESTNQLPLVKFDRYIAVDTPVRLLHGVTELDDFYRAPLAWPSPERQSDMENTLLKVAALTKNPPPPQAILPFNAIESRFLIGLAFRFTLRDIIYTSQWRSNEGILRHPIDEDRRGPLYREILQYSFRDYFEKFAAPYYQARGLAAPVADTLDKAGDLHSYESGLKANPRVRVIVNQNDFLLSEADRAWLHATFAPSQLTVFPRGGHLGNLLDPPVQQAIVAGLSGLK